MQTVELQKMGLTELQHDECMEVNGGNWLIRAIVGEILQHLDEIYDGFKKGVKLENI